MIIQFKRFGQGGMKYFMNTNAEDSELQQSLNSMRIDRQKDAMKQIIASMTIGKDVSKLFPDVVKIIRTKNIELKKFTYKTRFNFFSSSSFSLRCKRRGDSFNSRTSNKNNGMH